MTARAAALAAAAAAAAGLAACGGAPSPEDVAKSVKSAAVVDQPDWDVSDVTCAKQTETTDRCVIRFSLSDLGDVLGATSSRTLAVKVNDDGCWTARSTERDGSEAVSLRGCI